MEIDLHGYHPSEIDVAYIIRQCWEMGETEVILIHGHGHNRGISPGFVNTNTGMFGLSIRGAIRHGDVRAWAKISTLDCSQMGSTKLKLKHNPNPSRVKIDLPDRGKYAE